mmetsp:Transcript_7417/g.8969  ORF Transcript_7417/g.8969 Transcript_7417/m.8969 type:complete len:113 (-) Transcript_7417:2337-2675(-)
MIFWLSYFHFWQDLAATNLSLISFYLNRLYLQADSGTEVILAIAYLPWHNLNLFIIHTVLTKMGMLYVEAEVLRNGNDQLLDNLEEGVIIVDETANDIFYYNSAAAGLRKNN